MPLMPGIPVEGPWIPEGESMTEALEAREPSYKPEMAAKKDPNPFAALIGGPEAQKVEVAKPGWQERFIQHFKNQQRYGMAGIYDLGEIRDAETGYVRGVYVGEDQGKLYAEQLRSRREESQFQFDNMAPAETTLDYMAAIGGGLAGALVDPLSLVGPEVKIGTTAWRGGSPIVSRVLETGVSNAAMNAALNATVQAEEGLAGLRDAVDWKTLAIDTAAGFAFGVPFGFLRGRGAKVDTMAESFATAPEPGKATWAPQRPEEMSLEGEPTPEGVQSVHTPDELAAAQETLFGEVVGTRNLTPEQLTQLDDYLNAGKPVPQGPIETEGSALTNETLPEVQQGAQPPDQLVQPVPEPGRQEGPPAVEGPAPLPLSRTYREFSPEDLTVDAKRFQFKEGGDEAGVTDRLKGVKKWDQSKSGVTLVWESKDGKFYIADGHQRHALASRLGEQKPKILAYVLREADGISSDEARVLAAAKNIAEGTGNAIDAAKILRTRPDAAVDLPPTSALVRDAQGLAKLSDNAFGMVINRKVPAGFAALVGRIADDPATHADLLQLLAKNEPANAVEAESMIRDALEAPAVQSTMEDMFGSAETTQILFQERAQVLSSAATALRRDRAAFNTLVKEEVRLTGAGNLLATKANMERAATDAEILATLQATARRKGPIADALARAAKRLHDGEPRNTVVRDFLEDVRRSDASIAAGRGGAGAPGRQDEGIAARIAFSKRTEGPDLFTSERGADNQPQMVLPGAERITDKRLAELKAAAPLRSGKTQKDMDFGLFGSEKNQLDLVDLVTKSNIAFKIRGESDAIDFTPSGSPRSVKIGNSVINYAPHEKSVEIISLRTPVGFRKQGSASLALSEFLKKTDAEGLPVVIYSKPQDALTNEAGVVSLLQRHGFEPTGRTKSEFVHRGPSQEDAALRPIEESLDNLHGLIDAGAPITEIESHPFIGGAVRRIDALPSTDLQPGYMSDAWKASRRYDFAGEEVVGYDAAIARLTSEAMDFSVNGPVKREKLAIIVLGPPAAGKSTFAESIAATRFAAIVDSDEAKKVIPEFNRGIGANAVHEESSQMAADVMSRLLDMKANMVIPKVGHSADGIRKLILNLKSDGFSVDLVGVNVSYENAFRRMIRRFMSTGRLVNPAYVKAVGETPSETYRVLRQQGVADRYAEIDGNGNQGEPARLLDDTGAAEGLPGVVGVGRRESARPDVRAAGREEGQGIAFKKRPAGSGLPVNRAQAGTPTAGRQAAERLEDISADLASLTGAPVRQGRLQRARGGQVAGQFDRDQGIVRLREMSDFETQTHETAHSLETEWGRSLNTVKVQNRAELEAMAYAGADPKEKLTEGFAEWFRFYLSAPNYARNNAPQFTAAFEAMLKTRAPEQLAKIADLQARYVAWQNTPSRAATAADVVSSRRRNLLSTAVTEMREEGWQTTAGKWADKLYESLIDKLHPINTSVDELLKIYEKNAGKALDLKTAQDPYRLARMLADSYSAGHIDAMHGVVPYQGTISQGPSLSDALALALGKKVTGWDDELMADFAAYLISRRAIQEYDRLARGEIGNPPTKFTKGDHDVTVMELEAAHPEWAQAADMVYQWQQNMLRKKYESGFITQKLYDELMKRKDYVPFMRDLTDLDREVSSAPNKTLRNSIIKAFRGSKRSIINPLESMLADAYHFNALMKRNDVFKALDNLARTAGPGSGSIVERIPSTQLKGTDVNIEEVLRTAAKEAGLNPNDADQLTNVVGQMLGDIESATVFRAGEINEKGEPIIYVWRNGKKQALRLADGDFGIDLYNAMTGMSKEARNIFVSAMALPSTVLRYSITTSPPFILANYLRDQVSAWVLAGDGFIPFMSGAKGTWDEITQSEVSRIYNTVGGLFGGGNVASLDKGRAMRDISALNKKGYHVKRFANIRGFAEFTGIAETGTRLGVFSTAFKRAKREGLTDYEAAVEAVYQARDYIDFGRHGSQTHTVRRLVTFLNASLQGLDKTARVLSGEGSIKKAIAPYIAWRAGRPLSARDQRNIGHAAKAWAKVVAIGTFGLALSYAYRDDPEYEEISDYLRATHWMVKKGPGEWYAIPKPFELGFASNLFERSFDAVYGRDPIAMQSFISGLYEVTAPPMGIALFQTMYELKHNTTDFGMPIVGQDIAGFEPWRQYTAQTSAIAKQLGAAVNVSPAMIDHAIQGFGASWGRIITDASRDRAAEKGYVETVMNSMSNRFIRDVTRGATSTRQFWDLMSESVGPLTQAANTYKNLYENTGEMEAGQMLETRDENTKAYALLTTHFAAKEERLHPMIRAKDAVSAISKLRKDIAGNDVRMVADEESKILLTPSQRVMAQDILERLGMYETRNALITIGQPGWAQRDYMDTQSLRDQLRLALPELADELEARYEKKKVYDEATVREAWPEVKARILEDRQDANFSDIVAGAR